MIYIYIYDTYIICIYIQTHGFFLQLQFFKTKKASQISANLIPPIVDSVRRLGHLWSGVFHQQRLPDWTFGRRSHSQWLCSTLSRSWPYQCPWSDPWWWPCLEGVKVKGVRRRCGSRRCSSWDEKGIPEKMADGSMFFFSTFWNISINGKKKNCIYLPKIYSRSCHATHLFLSHISKEQPTQWGSRLSYPPPLSAPTRNRGWGETRDIASFHWKQKN